MVHKICPICDQKLSGSNYCSHCRQWIRNPLTIDVDYYLNERHPNSEHDCTYHDYPDPESARTPRQTPVPNQPRTVRRSAVPNQPRTDRRSVSPGQPQPGGRAAAYGQPRTAQNRTLPVLIIIMIILMIFLTVIPILFSIVSSTMRLSGSLSPDGDFAGWETRFASEKTREYEEWEVDEADVIAAGANCTSYGHFQTTADQMAEELLPHIETQGALLVSKDEFSVNTENNYGSSSYNRHLLYSYNSGADSLELLSDTATGQLHSVSISWEEEDMVIDLLEQVTALLRANGDWELSETATTEWLKELRDQLPSTDFDSFTPEGAGDDVGVFIMSYDDGGYYITIDKWQ